MRLLKSRIACALLAALAASCATRDAGRSSGKAEEARWFGVHLYIGERDEIPVLKRMIAESLAPNGVNVLVLEWDCHFAFQTHPELEVRPEPMNIHIDI